MRRKEETMCMCVRVSVSVTRGCLLSHEKRIFDLRQLSLDMKGTEAGDQVA